MKKYSLIVLLFGVYLTSFAQTYNTAFGMRVGTELGFTIQQRIAKKVTIEAILQSSFQRKEVVVTGLVEQHFPLISKRFNVYMGAGLHKGWETDEEIDYTDPFGVTVVLGGEMTLGRLNISYDFKPVLNLQGGLKRFDSQTGISLRYVIIKKKIRLFKKRKRKKKKNKINWRFWENW